MKLDDYIRGRRKGKAARSIERDAMGDPFLADALEGFDTVDADHAGTLEMLSARIAGRIRAGRRLLPRRIPVWRRPAVWASAAAILVCSFFSGLIYLHSTRIYDPMASMSLRDTISVSRGYTVLAAAEILFDLPSMVFPVRELSSDEVNRFASEALRTMEINTAVDADLSITDFADDPGVFSPPVSYEETGMEGAEIVVAGHSAARAKAVTGAVPVESPDGSPRQERTAAVASLSPPLPRSELPDVYGYAPGDIFVSAAAAPVSYFPVSTGGDSYGNIRRRIEEGSLPTASEVRTEELINHFSYSYGEPEGNEPARISYETGSCPWNPDHILVIIGVRSSADSVRTTEIVAEGVRLRAVFDPSTVESYRLIGYSAGRPGHGDGPGELLDSGRNITVIYELVPARATRAGGELLRVEMDFREPGRRKNRQLKESVKDTSTGPSADFYFAAAVALFGELLSGNTAEGDYDLIISTARMGLAGNSDMSRAEFIRLVQEAKMVDSRRQYLSDTP